ncbi:PD-(D/E)XK nuclease family protein [Psychrobacter aquimaris]|uniref:PDDEXK-like family protein n=1 Tax=Psychrobacter aquimaris TaxID=292733 RepID=UPI0039C70218
MDIIQLKKLIEHIKSLPTPEIPEQTIFSIGGRGYYENPTSDVLAFFCDSEGAHGLGNLMMEALFDALTVANPKSANFDFGDFSVINEPGREVTTKSNKRIDLLLEGNDWVMVIENKIYHHQVNPFKTYQKHIESNDEFKYKQHIYVVLSPNGKAPNNWLSLSYPIFLDSIREKLARAFITQPLNKWLVLLREFILHLEGIMSDSTMPHETVSYVLENLAEIKQAEDIKQKVIEAYQKELLEKLQGAFPNEKVRTKLHHWHGYPALRFSFESWETKTDVVLFLDGRKNNKFCINYYAFNINTPEQREIADSYLKQENCSSTWSEGSGKVKCYKSPYESFDKDTAHEFLIEKLSLLDEFETQVRSQW